MFPQVGVRREITNFRRPRKKKVKILNLRSFIVSVYCALTFPGGFGFTYPRCQIALVGVIYFSSSFWSTSPAPQLLLDLAFFSVSNLDKCMKYYQLDMRKL